MQAMRDTTEAPLETDRLVIHLQLPNRARCHVQHDLPITGKTIRDLYARMIGINQQMWRAVIIDDPLIQRPNQIRTT